VVGVVLPYLHDPGTGNSLNLAPELKILVGVAIATSQTVPFRLLNFSDVIFPLFSGVVRSNSPEPKLLKVRLESAGRHWKSNSNEANLRSLVLVTIWRSVAPGFRLN
jgi:hypothetical protein